MCSCRVKLSNALDARNGKNPYFKENFLVL